MKNKVLVMMSTYNGEKYIQAQVESIFKQVGNFEITLLIRDDGSVDNTEIIINRMIAKYNNIKFVKGENIGCNASYFALFKLAVDFDCNYYALSDQDDIWMDNKIQNAINKLANVSPSKPALYGNCSYLVKNDLIPYGITQRKIKKITSFNTIIQNFLPGHSQVFNRELLKYLIDDVDVNKIYVYDSWITNIAMNFGVLFFDNAPRTYYRMHDENVVGYSKSKLKWLEERIRRMNQGDVYRQSLQINYFIEKYCGILDSNFLNEMSKFMKYNSTFLTRVLYVCNCKLYRQKYIETFYFKLLYVLGKYKVESKGEN